MSAAEKNRSRIADFFSAEYSKLARYVRRKIDETAEMDSEDIIQDVMLNLFNKADISIPIENLSAYVYQSLRNRIADSFRKKAANPSVHSMDTNLKNGRDEENSHSLADMINDIRYDAHDAMEKNEMLQHMYDAIGRLDEKYKAVLIATEMEGRSFRELGIQWDIPVGTLLARKTRALKKVQSALAKYTH